MEHRGTQVIHSRLTLNRRLSNSNRLSNKKRRPLNKALKSEVRVESTRRQNLKQEEFEKTVGQNRWNNVMNRV